jgi:hypothetical protein
MLNKTFAARDAARGDNEIDSLSINQEVIIRLRSLAACELRYYYDDADARGTDHLNMFCIVFDWICSLMLAEDCCPGRIRSRPLTSAERLMPEDDDDLQKPQC